MHEPRKSPSATAHGSHAGAAAMAPGKHTLVDALPHAPSGHASGPSASTGADRTAAGSAPHAAHGDAGGQPPAMRGLFGFGAGGGGGPQGGGSSASGPARESRTQHTEALIFVEEGRNLRVGRSDHSKLIRLLHYGERVFVNQHDAGGGWAQVTTSHGEEGYVSNDVVKTDLPCPGARLHIVGDGETALGIAGRYFGAVEKPGHDGRFFVNVLRFVNPNAVSEGGDWHHVKFAAGRSIWIPTPKFAHTLRGKVDDGSITNGLWAEAKDAVETAIDIAAGAVAFTAGLLEGIALEVKDTLTGLADLVDDVIHLLKDAVKGKILDDLEGLWHELQSIDLKAALAEFLDKWNADNPWDKWRFRGEVVGRVATEVALWVLSGGVAAVVSGTSKFARLTATVSHLRFVRRVEHAARKAEHALPSKLDALRTRRRPHRKKSDARVEERSHRRNDARPGSGTPAAKPWRSRSAGKGLQHQMLHARAQQAIKDGATDIRVDQAQVGAARDGEAVGDRLGDNRPDLQYTDHNGERHYVEYDAIGSDRGRQHLRRILANDPGAHLELWQEIRVRHGNRFDHEYVKVF
jgi:hypothetical protein